MTQVSLDYEVLTLAETAAFLRVSEEAVTRLVQYRGLPAQKVDDGWRFLKLAVEDWLRYGMGREAFLAQAGALGNDADVKEVLKHIYEHRGRPETAED